jgi:hypothetical protein
VRDVSANSKDIATLTVSLGLQVLLLPYAKGELLAEVMRAVVLLLGHRYPKVRKAAADALYVHFLTYGDPQGLAPAEAAAEAGVAEGPERAEALQQLLMETPWLGSLEEHARPARGHIIDLLGLPPPQVAAAAPPKKKETTQDTYAELVGEMGY